MSCPCVRVRECEWECQLGPVSNSKLWIWYFPWFVANWQNQKQSILHVGCTMQMCTQTQRLPPPSNRRWEIRNRKSNKIRDHFDWMQVPVPVAGGWWWQTMNANPWQYVTPHLPLAQALFAFDFCRHNRRLIDSLWLCVCELWVGVFAKMCEVRHRKRG